MKEVTGPIVATALVLCAVFVPAAFISGLTGEFYRQFALTIAISTVISAFNSLTLSPALAALLLKERGAPKDALSRGIDRAFGWLFRPFNRFFVRSANSYVSGVQRVLRAGSVALIIYGGLVLLGVFRLCQGADRLRAGAGQAVPGVVRAAAGRVVAGPLRSRDTPHERHRLEAAGRGKRGRVSRLSINGFTNSTNSWHRFRHAEAVRGAPRCVAFGRCDHGGAAAEVCGDPGCLYRDLSAPPGERPGTIGGFRLQVEDRGDQGFEELYKQTQNLITASQKEPALAGLFSSYQVSVPQIDADVDPRKGQGRRRGSERCLPDHAGLSRLALRQQTSIASVAPTRSTSRPSPVSATSRRTSPP